MGDQTKRCIAVLGAVLAFGAVAQADVSILTLSTNSSDETPAEVLDARFEFEVVGSLLELTVFNETADTQTFNIDEIYFNAASNVTDLDFAGLTGWTFAEIGSDPDNDRKANGFGVFDYSLKTGTLGLITPGTSKKFEFSITGTGVLATDFTSEFSTLPPGDKVMRAAAKFVGGSEDDDSAYGGVVPAPGAALLGMFGFSMVGWVKRKFA